MRIVHKIDEASVLQMMAVMVAIPRYAGAFAYALGVDVIVRYPGFVDAEVASATALAVLEGWAIAYVVRAIRRLPANSVHAKRLVIIVGVLLMMLPLVGTPYMVGVGSGNAAGEIMHPVFVWLWKFVINAVVPVFVAAVGYASGAQPTATSVQRSTMRNNGNALNARTANSARHDEIVRFLRGGSAQITDIAQALGVHRNTASKDVRALAELGVIEKNGRGWKLVGGNND